MNPFPIEAWTLLGRAPAALVVVTLLVHVWRRGRASHAAAAVAGLSAGFVAG